MIARDTENQVRDAFTGEVPVRLLAPYLSNP